MTQLPPTPVAVIPIADHELARRVLRWLAVGGVVLGAAQVVGTAAQLMAWSLRPPTSPDRVAVNALYRIAAVITVLAPAILIAGSVGVLLRKRWARPALMVYAFLQVTGALAGVAIALIFMLSFGAGDNWTLAQKLAWPLMRVEDMLLHCLYPAAILLCLVRPGLMPMPSTARSTFEVLPAVGGPTMPAH
jgi:hypothetical protein